MSRPSLQAVIHACLADPADAGLNPRQRQVCHHILDCRTAALGGFCLECDQCQEHAFLYHACRDSHCPRCQRQASQDWCERQRAAVLPVTYHHLVFTLPDVLNGWVEVQPQEVYGLLFAAVWATLSAFGTDPKHLDGQMGMTAMLHTWGRTAPGTRPRAPTCSRCGPCPGTSVAAWSAGCAGPSRPGNSPGFGTGPRWTGSSRP